MHLATVGRSLQAAWCVQPVASYTDFELDTKVTNGSASMGASEAEDAVSAPGSDGATSASGTDADAEAIDEPGSESDEEGDGQDKPHRLLYVLQRVDTQ